MQCLNCLSNWIMKSLVNRNRVSRRAYVPFYSVGCIPIISNNLILITIIFLTTSPNLANCVETEHLRDKNHHHHYVAPSPYLTHEYNRDVPLSADFTPNLKTLRRPDSTHLHSYLPITEKSRRSISPQRLSDQLDSFEPDGNLFSPIFGQDTYIQENHQHLQERNTPFDQVLNVDTNANLLDMVESGSGGGIDLPNEDNNVGTEYLSRKSTNQLSTPRYDGSNEPSRSDQAPSLSRRLPVLVATAGLPWRYTIPADTFEDEDGSMRNLRSSLELKHSSDTDDSRFNNEANGANVNQPFDKYMHWLQYDDRIQTLFGYPTMADVGKHNYEIVVADNWGQTNNASIEIIVRQHPSIRAFSHAFSLVDIEWDSQKYNSLTKALTDIVRRITENIYSDSTNKNFVIHSLILPAKNLSTVSINRALSPMTIIWSNSSIPVYPCHTSQLDFLLRNLVEEQYYSPNQTSLQDNTSSFTPSHSLRKVLEPNFKLTRVDFKLQGSCRNTVIKSGSMNQTDSPDLDPMLRTRIQKLQWRLGQPFLYQIPENTFLAEGSSMKTSDLILTIHTIDGIPLEDDSHFDFIEFDQESRTLYGLPYDTDLHSGQRELLLTARYSNLDQKVARDVLIVDIIPPSLSTVKNRAFNMSLYFTARVNAFSPKVRVGLGQKIVRSLNAGELNYASELSNIEFVVVEIKKFQVDAQMSALLEHANSWAYHDKIRRIEDSSKSDQKDILDSRENSILYKLTWTNESIGYLGDCPIEVITENVVSALEHNMFEYVPSDDEDKFEDPNKNDSVKFYERLRSYFEPEIDLAFLSIGPMDESACVNSLGYYDVGNSDLADLVNLADSSVDRMPQPDYVLPIGTLNRPMDESKLARPMINSDEYWSIVVLIILVVALMFVVMMFFMGMHTYRINQEKRFELQVKLAQARQNSMYLSSMMIADQMPHPEFNGIQHGMSTEDGSSRKPVILDSERQPWTNGHTDLTMYKPTAVQMQGQTIQTTPLRPNMTFTLDSIASMQANHAMAPAMMMPNQFFFEDRKRSMTLNRRNTSDSQQSRMMVRQASMNQLNHSQSILTMASPVQFMPHLANMPVVYAPLPVVCETNEMSARQN